MAKTYTRALRRFHRARMVNRAKTIQRHWWWFDQQEDSEQLNLTAKKLADNISICSCHMCRNVRHSGFVKQTERLTMAERRAAKSHQDQLEDYYETTDDSLTDY